MRTPYVKDGFHEYVVHGNKGAVNPEGVGTKAAAHYQVTVGAEGELGGAAAVDAGRCS